MFPISGNKYCASPWLINIVLELRNSRLCFGLYEKDKKGNNSLVGWTNRTIFDFQGNMRKPFSMYFWNNRNLTSSHELLNPYKLSEEVNEGTNAISMEV